MHQLMSTFIILEFVNFFDEISGMLQNILRIFCIQQCLRNDTFTYAKKLTAGQVNRLHRTKKKQKK